MSHIGIIVYHQCPTDTIVCLSLPIYYSTIYDSIILLVTQDACSIYKMLEFVYRNIKCEIIYVKAHLIMNTVNYIMENKNNRYDYLPHGIWYCSQHPNFIQNKCLTTNSERYLACSQYFYSNFTKHILDSKICFEYFNIDRDVFLEEIKYKEITAEIGEKYYIINANINTYNKALLPNLNFFNLSNSSETVFDMIKVIENAQEIHIVSTFWSLIIYYLQKRYNLFENTPIYFHSYVRHGRLEGLYNEHGTLTNWKFYTCQEDCNDSTHLISGL